MTTIIRTAKQQPVTAPTSYAALLPILASRRTSVHLTSRTAAQLVAAIRYAAFLDRQNNKTWPGINITSS